MKRLLISSLILIMLASCAGNPPAPVVNRSPQSDSGASTANTASVKSTQNGDWRPDTYIVQKGDTLYSIGLNLGLDYREIAAANNIYEPFTIRIGQQLKISSIKARENLDDTPKASYENEDGVIISAVDVGGETSATQNTTTTSTVTPVISSPKAIREPYSLAALNRTTPPATVAIKETVTTIPTKPATPPTTSKTAEATQSSDWKWPTKGKVIEGFHPANNKGIDISGKMGQSINAAAAGKVIYAGSDLRGYGKLVIVKHNKTFLSVYAHNSKILVKEGEQVSQGEMIAKMGNTDTNKVKLHFEIRERGKSIDPTKYLPQNTL